jgi:hypothetical protein
VSNAGHSLDPLLRDYLAQATANSENVSWSKSGDPASQIDSTEKMESP